MKVKHYLAVLSFFAISLSNAQEVSVKNQAKYLFYVTNYLDWGHREITIGVIGESPITAELQQLLEKNPNITLEKVTDVEKIIFCDLLFLPESKTADFDLIQSEIGELPIIVVTENEKLAFRGAEISFFEKNGKLKFAMNREAFEMTGIKIDGKLLAYSEVLDDEHSLD